MYITSAQRVRLADGNAPFKGRAEYKDDDGIWGTICDSSFGSAGWPSVLCLELGYGMAVDAYHFPDTTKLPITMHNAGCTPSTALYMSECYYYDTGCTHALDVFIICTRKWFAKLYFI